MAHDNPLLRVTREEAERIEARNTRRLLFERRLSLILDLDQTVIHATMQPNLRDWIMDPDKLTAYPALQDVHYFTLSDRPTDCYFVKFRPHLREFLRAVGQLYEMHIYTMGTRGYASKISKLIDPEGSIFKERILSRDESGSMTMKTVQRLFPCDDSMVVVVDDRADVWQWSASLIKVWPYHFFVGTGDIHAPPTTTGASLSHSAAAGEGLPNDRERFLPFQINDDDLELDTLTGILTELHSNFYSRIPAASLHHFSPSASPNGPVRLPDSADVKSILSAMKSRVLNGVRLAFSGFIPNTIPAEQSEWWLLAVSFGAQCSHAVLDPDPVTHLVASKWGTEKVLQAHRKGMHIVRPQWLRDSIAKWSLQPETDYALKSEGDTLVARPVHMTDELTLLTDSDLVMDVLREVEEEVGGETDDDVASTQSRRTETSVMVNLKRRRSWSSSSSVESNRSSSSSVESNRSSPKRFDVERNDDDDSSEALSEDLQQMLEKFEGA